MANSKQTLNNIKQGSKDMMEILGAVKSGKGFERFLEVHVKGTTALNSKVEEHKRGKFLGLSSKAMIEVYKNANVTCLQIMPVFTADSETQKTFWNYDTTNWHTLNKEFGTEEEFKMMVEELHQAGIKVILDVVFNHTGKIDFTKNPEMIGVKYGEVGYSGCGHDVLVNDESTLEVLLPAVDKWLAIVDGFRFDLGGVLGRLNSGEFTKEAPFFKHLEKWEDKIFTAEMYDLHDHMYGRFPSSVKGIGHFWRDDIRQGKTWQKEWFPSDGVQCVTNHDGFALKDLVSFNSKHNERNGENNRDGNDSNHSWNHYTEGYTTCKETNNNRLNHVRWLMTQLVDANTVSDVLVFAPDLCLTGFEGCNNNYKIDNETAYINWENVNPFSNC